MYFLLQTGDKLTLQDGSGFALLQATAAQICNFLLQTGDLFLLQDGGQFYLQCHGGGGGATPDLTNYVLRKRRLRRR